MEKEIVTQSNDILFTGNIFIFHAYDVGDDIDLEAVEKSHVLIQQSLLLPKYFKNYHTPLEVELPHPHQTSACWSTKIHSFGAISLTYKIPFHATLDEVRKEINDIEAKYQEQSISDANTAFKKLKPFITQPRFFHLRNSYLVVQIMPNPAIDIVTLKQRYGSIIASILRFETESLSEYQKNEILESAMGYYRGDLIIIDTEAAFIADDEYEEIIDLFEFANIQQLELQYFDRVLDQQLNTIYERKIRPAGLKAYMPFIKTKSDEAVEALGQLKVDISVITERLESSIKLVGEAYFSDMYAMLVNKLDLQNWKESIDRKLEIIKDVLTIYQNQTESRREDILSVLIIILIAIELVIGLLNYLSC